MACSPGTFPKPWTGSSMCRTLLPNPQWQSLLCDSPVAFACWFTWTPKSRPPQTCLLVWSDLCSCWSRVKHFCTWRHRISVSLPVPLPCMLEVFIYSNTPDSEEEVIVRFRQSLMTSWSSESGVLEQGNIYSMQDRGTRNRTETCSHNT